MFQRPLNKPLAPGAGLVLRHGKSPSFRRERGVVLLLVMVLLLITAAASIYFHNSMVSTTRISGVTRDNTESLLLAESAMEWLRGGFINTLDSEPTIHEAGCAVYVDEDTSITQDKCEAYSVRRNLDAADRSVTQLAHLHYVYFVNDGTGADGITQVLPSVLQRVADGEAVGVADGSTRVDEDHQVLGSQAQLNLNDLFSGTAKPFVFVPNENGLIDSTPTATAASWTGVNEQEKAAAWLEFTRNTDNDEAMDIWVEAVGQAGFARSYLQRYVGTFYPPTTVGYLAALIEASNIDRSVNTMKSSKSSLLANSDAWCVPNGWSHSQE